MQRGLPAPIGGPRSLPRPVGPWGWDSTGHMGGTNAPCEGAPMRVSDRAFEALVVPARVLGSVEQWPIPGAG